MENLGVIVGYKRTIVRGGKVFSPFKRHQPSLSGAELRLGEPNPKGKAVAPKRNARRRTKREERE